MASLQKKYNQQKRLGQVYTPAFIVQKMLDDVGLKERYVIGKKILDPACGDGRFLEAILQRMIVSYPREQLLEALPLIHGWDIDPEAVAACKSNLNQQLAQINLQFDAWNIEVKDALSMQSSGLTFDFIVGNPPYIRIQHLELAQRNYIKEHYQFCQSGSTDIYIAFYELAFQLLAPEGKCAFITPNTFFYTETGRAMRDFFCKNHVLGQVTNYGELQIFENATTYSAIVIFQKVMQEDFLYQQAIDFYHFEEGRLDTSSLFGKRTWQLSTQEPPPNTGRRLGDICNIHVGITTLCDKAYIFNITNVDDHLVMAHSRLLGDRLLEKGILKGIIKGSTLKNGNDPITEYVLFPYQLVSKKHKIIPEKDLAERFPLAYQYLCDVRPWLDKRDNGKPNKVAWYAFGRNQGLDTSFGKKIIFSPMNKQPNFILSTYEDCTFYSAYCIKCRHYETLLEKLNSQAMADYISISGRDFLGGWKAYNKRIVEGFIIENDVN